MRTPSSGSGGGRPRTCALALAAALGSGSCFVDEPHLTTTTTDTTGGASTSTTGDETTSATGETTGSAAVCGDGRIEGDEECDSGDLNGAGSLCTLACKVNVCGDGVPSPVEGCDDGDDDDADECTNACTLPRCGDAIVQAGEGCDDGNEVDGDGCSGVCALESCGDGIVQEGEACDDGNTVDDDRCTNNCTTPMCGDGIVQASAGEACDEGPDNGAGLCSLACTVVVCGDGVVDVGEVCDDGNEVDGDGCSSACVRDALFVFVTDKSYNGNLGGRVGADEKCQGEAGEAGLPGTFRAWISDSTGAPVDDFAMSAFPYLRIDGVMVAADWVDLTDGNLGASIQVTATGELLQGDPDGCPSFTGVWTNTESNGERETNNHCNDWSLSNFTQGEIGRYDRMNGAWSDACVAICLSSYRLYCFEQPI